MAKFKCPHCGEVFKRDKRFKMVKGHMTKRGYLSYCNLKPGIVYCKEVKCTTNY